MSPCNRTLKGASQPQQSDDALYLWRRALIEGRQSQRDFLTGMRLFDVF